MQVLRLTKASERLLRSIFMCTFYIEYFKISMFVDNSVKTAFQNFVSTVVKYNYYIILYYNIDYTVQYISIVLYTLV